MRPNIFNIATSELSQDAFIVWLIEWSNPDVSIYDEKLYRCGVDFVLTLLRKKYKDFNQNIKQVKVLRQWGQKHNIDVAVFVNNKFLIIVEDKTFSAKHSGQLSRYKTEALEWCKKNGYYAPVCIYLKTGNESLNDLKLVKEEGFKVFNRQEFLSVLNQHKIGNNIFIDFNERLSKLEELNHQWEKNAIGIWDYNDWQGFFQFLETQDLNIANWKKVNNKSNGFWCVVFDWQYWNGYPVYMQIEQYKLCFKICTDRESFPEIPEFNNRSEPRNQFSTLLRDYFKNNCHGLGEVNKPQRFGYGKYMTVAVVEQEDWLGEENSIIKKEKVVESLNLYQNHFNKLVKQIRDK